MSRTGARAPKPNSAPVVDLTLTSVSEDELRRRAADGDRRALAELRRRGALIRRKAA